MTRILFDTNIVLDVLLDRQPFAAASASAWRAVETGVAKGMLSAHALTTIHYLFKKSKGDAAARDVIASLLFVFEIVPVSGTTFEEALRLCLADFEDAVTAVSALRARCGYIATRDLKDFRGSPVPPLTPESLAEILKKRH